MRLAKGMIKKPVFLRRYACGGASTLFVRQNDTFLQRNQEITNNTTVYRTQYTGRRRRAPTDFRNRREHHTPYSGNPQPLSHPDFPEPLPPTTLIKVWFTHHNHTFESVVLREKPHL